jgi:pimeloyl-ACP methyl ester carboxylesterase
MYVQYEIPRTVTQPYPLVLVHGGGGQGTDFLGTPDGRPGWAEHFVRQGYAVYVVDRPGLGRSPYDPDVLGEMTVVPYLEFIVQLTAPASAPEPHPFAHLHTQWPGSGLADDPTVGQLAASDGPSCKDMSQVHTLMRSRGAELVDRIGPSVIVTHSGGGPFGWLVADARPDAVRAIVAIEPFGPGFLHLPQIGVSLPWGLTAIPLTMDPPADSPEEMARTVVHTDEPGVLPYALQADPVRQFVNLRDIPIAVMTSEASWLAQMDAGTVAFLRQAGCQVEHLRLTDHGIHGNGHVMMVEKNHIEVAGVLDEWVRRRTAG